MALNYGPVYAKQALQAGPPASEDVSVPFNLEEGWPIIGIIIIGLYVAMRK